MEPRKCKTRKIRKPSECDVSSSAQNLGTTPDWAYKITNKSYLVAQINFTNDTIVDCKTEIPDIVSVSKKERIVLAKTEFRYGKMKNYKVGSQIITEVWKWTI